jgi:hypothetical protein
MKVSKSLGLLVAVLATMTYGEFCADEGFVFCLLTIEIATSVNFGAHDEAVRALIGKFQIPPNFERKALT